MFVTLEKYKRLLVTPALGSFNIILQFLNDIFLWHRGKNIINVIDDDAKLGLKSMVDMY